MRAWKKNSSLTKFRQRVRVMRTHASDAGEVPRKRCTREFHYTTWTGKQDLLSNLIPSSKKSFRPMLEKHRQPQPQAAREAPAGHWRAWAGLHPSCWVQRWGPGRVPGHWPGPKPTRRTPNRPVPVRSHCRVARPPQKKQETQRIEIKRHQQKTKTKDGKDVT